MAAGLMRVLVVNAGSSSLKLALVDGDDRTVAALELPAPRSEIDADAVRAAVRVGGLEPADAVGHRIVHGGQRFTAATRVDGDVTRALRELADLAPLHQAKSLAALEAVTAALGERPAVACFDTAFHATLPDAAATFALPAAWRERWGLRRFGFHGLSHAAVARWAPRGRVVSCHLGAGASLCAIADGVSVDTTMGFTPLDGLVMATRSGSVDPGLLLWIQEHTGLTEPEVAHALEHESGLLALAGVADMREVLARAAADDGRATLAVEVYVHRLAAGVAAMAAALGGLDTLVFTGGVGEHAAEIRALAAERLAFLGVAVDRDTNARADGDAEITGASARVRTHVRVAREDVEIARQTRAALGD